jgi:hypothetical protein
MFSKVYVTANEAGQVVIRSKENPIYGHIRLEQKRTVITDKGWVRSKTLSALMHGTVEELESLEFAAGEVLPGKIVIKESLTPFNLKDPSVDYKIAGNTNIVCVSGDQPIYRKTFYNQSGTDVDETIPHTNGEAIRQANQQLMNEDIQSEAEMDNDTFTL